MLQLKFLKQKTEAGTNFVLLYYVSREIYGWAIQKSLFAETNQDPAFSHTLENSKMLNNFKMF